ncbi:uncharacterized protein LOC118735299 isoform X1 [Rhagoletis pomonella]|uniref:uncharacterized protein LOC118735299 isoform X1 n=1 Tax=Rhagoletis pomonella TaxID=28610 RepID=UPI0017859289|nr:uncharacterized protein LOC118735299 isoform X1 [Rhagoletis pomonella]
MAPGAPKLGDNRFALLSPPTRAKRKKTTNISEEFPELPVTKKDDPKFVTIKPKDSNKAFTEYSNFALHKSLLSICKQINSISQQSDGSLVVLVKNREYAKKFIDARLLPGLCAITANYHDNLNCVKGTVYVPFLNNVPENEIVDGLKEYNVTNLYKFQRITEGVSKPTGVILISFDNYFLPDKIDIAWITTKVRPFYPNPMRCKNCQKLGHTLKFCKNMPACQSCNLPPHTPAPCIRTYCANCAGEHAASSNSCQKYQQAKEIMKIKTQEKCTLREANKIYKTRNPLSLNPNSLANIIKENSSNQISKAMQNSSTNYSPMTQENPSITTLYSTTTPISKPIVPKTSFPSAYPTINNQSQPIDTVEPTTDTANFGTTTTTTPDDLSHITALHSLRFENDSVAFSIANLPPFEHSNSMELEAAQQSTQNFHSTSNIHLTNNLNDFTNSSTSSAAKEYITSKVIQNNNNFEVIPVRH